MPKRVLVLSGGGAMGIFQVGCLRALLAADETLDFDFFVGVSAGALNAAFLAQAPMKDECGSPTSRAALMDQLDALEVMWRAVESPADIYDGPAEPGVGTLLKVVLGKDSLVDASPIRRLIDQNISTRQALASNRGLHIGTTSLRSGDYVGFEIGTAAPTPDLDLVTAVKASSAVPGVFSPVKYGNDLLVDGAVRNNTPLALAFAQHPTDEIVAIQTKPVGGRIHYEDFDVSRAGLFGGGNNALDVLVRSTRIMLEEIQKDDVLGAHQWSRAIKLLESLADEVGGSAGQAAREEIDALGKAAVPVRLYAPRGILLSNELDFKIRDMDQMYEEGRRAAAAPVDP